MKRRLALILAVGLCLLCGVLPTANAGPYSDDMAKCLVASTSTRDKSILVQWMFASMALHPEVKWMAKVTDAQRADLNQQLATMFENLLTQSCLTQSQAAIKYEGAGTIETSFGVLGQVAARELFSHPNVAAGMNDLSKMFDEEKLKAALGPTP